MKRVQFSGTPCVSNQVQSAEPLDIFELMFTDELVGHITQQTNLYFKQNIVGKIFKKHSRIQKHLSSVPAVKVSYVLQTISVDSLHPDFTATLFRSLLLICSTPKVNFSKQLASKRYYRKID